MTVVVITHNSAIAPILEAYDMTTEAAVTKLMWALGQGMAAGHICELFSRNLAGEITVKDERNGQMR